MKISVNTQREIAYDLHFSDNLFSLENKLLLTGRNERSRNCFIVVDKNVYANFGSQIENYFQNRTESFHILQLEAEEDSKNIKNFIKISEELNKYPIKRRCEPIIIIGGGVIGDLASFAASCLRRGIPHIKVPTTVMAYVDASVGIKTGINFGAYKNRLGSFSEPISVLFDKTLFSTLPKRDIANGIGEIIKLAVIKNIDLFYSLEEKIDTIFQTNFQDPSCQNILETSIIDMVEELEPNLFEKKPKKVR
jgi:3-dehydroquinate synthase